MADADRKDLADKALDLVVYGPVGLALYLRDTAPHFARLFVARGRNELRQARAVGELATTLGGPRLRRIFDEGVGKARTRVGEVIETLGSIAQDSVVCALGEEPGAQPSQAPTEEWDEPDWDEPEWDDPNVAVASRDNGAGVNGQAAETSGPAVMWSVPGATVEDRVPVASLAIADYDSLAATQVVERLEGLSPSELEAIRSYEVAHRSRYTILGKIDQLIR